jgi:hypothetical protein
VNEPVATSPDWIRAAVRSAAGELRSFAATGWAFVRRPRFFGETWARNSVLRLNPLAFMATSLAIVSAAGVVMSHFAKRQASSESGALWPIVRDALMPYAHYIGVGLCAQAILWLLGGRRPFRDAAAVAVYAGAIASLVIGVPLDAWLAIHGEFKLTLQLDLAAAPFLAFIVVPIVAFYVPLGRSLAGLYQGTRVGNGRVIFALVFTWLASGLFFGMVKPPGQYGVRPTIAYHHHAPAADGSTNSLFFGFESN